MIKKIIIWGINLNKKPQLVYENKKKTWWTEKKSGNAKVFINSDMCEDDEHKTKYQVKDLIKRISLKVSLFSNQKLKKKEKEKEYNILALSTKQNKKKEKESFLVIEAKGEKEREVRKG